MRYLILGVTEARDENGGALPVGGPRLRALLAALALRAGRPVPVADLVDDVWADEPPHDAPAALQALVGRLRRALGRDAITSTQGGYRLEAGPDEVDLHVFERLSRQGAGELDAGDPVTAARTLRTALALWRGPALADLPGREHGHGLRPEAHRLAALERRIEADLRSAGEGAATGTGGAGTGTGTGPGSGSGPRTLVPELEELTAAHPYDERFRSQLIRALRAEGRRADALAAYEDARRTLADDLGTDPGPELAGLHRELLAPPRIPSATAGPPARTGPSATAGPPATTGPSATTGPVTATGPSGAAGPCTVQGNLRPRLNSFVGREPELRSIEADLTRSRLVTLTGPGGSGKTRLAEEAAVRGDRTGSSSTEAGPPFTEAWMAELAPVEDPADVPGAVLSALGLRETALLRDNRDAQPSRTDPTELLVEHLAHCSRVRPVLLVLDNCEHVVGAAAALAETLLTHCPGLRVLATSREPLGVPGESVRPVGPLPADPAHRLFAERARAVRPGFDPEQEAAHDPDAVAEICRRLDGQPLAIELAAARLRMLSPRQIADRLDDRFRLLTGGSRTVLPRQQTLRAVVDWSWDLLDGAERTALRQVSVFAGGWDLAAAEAVVTTGRDRPPVADLIGALVDKSLVVATPTGSGDMRYRLLETIHEYAVERAAETPDVRAAAEDAHTAYFVALVEEADPRLRSGDQLLWIERLETDLDNIRAALHRTVVTRALEPEAIRLVLGMGWFWWLRDFRTEGHAWAERTMALGPEPAGDGDPRHWPRRHLEMLLYFLAIESRPADDVHGDERYQALMNRVADAFMAPGPQSARFPGLLWPMTLFGNRPTEEAHARVEQVVANTRAHGGDWEYCVALMFRTHMIVDMPGGMPGVDDDLAELRELSRRVGDRWIRAQAASAAAEAGAMRGRYAQAREAYEEALLLAREVGAHAEAPFILARLAEIAHRTGDTAAFERHLAESESEADRYQVHDAHAYGCFLRATAALDRGDLVEARRLVTEVEGEDGHGIPPSHFTAIVQGLAARVTAREPGPGRGPAAAALGLTAALRGARDARCAELVTGQLAEGAAAVLPELGMPGAAVRILAAADNWRPSAPRTRAEQAEVDGASRRAREELGSRRYESERAAGRALTVDDVIDLLTRITAGLPAPGLPAPGLSAPDFPAPAPTPAAAPTPAPGVPGVPGTPGVPGAVPGAPDRLTGS
ncbi:BTAD domain-containing putative transcriptional regulator [Streptomyces sp. NPDC006435]|uniref:AfsR/SARP family transcriptional regulator n=1 Tax=Streptomyces sp. NPDC006435 TaxID=3154300 RepID=UPI00339EE9AC